MIQRARILFVDDEERIVNLLRMMFRNTYEVFTATSGAQALEIVRAHEIHVIVTDQRMPGMLGVELLSLVCKESPDTVRLLLTGYSDLAAIVGSVNEGEVFRFISKPWNQDEIRETLAEAVQVSLLSASTGKSGPRVAEDLPKPSNLPSVLLLDECETDRMQIAKSIAHDHTVHHASSVPEAIAVLEKYEVGVMICEARVGGRDTGELLHVLKNNFPAIITVMLTHSADSDAVIKLINQARIYRFATKPIRTSVLQLSVTAAMREHVRCMTDARHAARQRTVRNQDLEPTLAQSILQGLKGLTLRWRLFSV